MERLNVNPTRMELRRLKDRYNVARRGHKLLKDKRDELMKRFLEIVRVNRDLRKKVEKALVDAQKSFAEASAIMSSAMMEQALMLPNRSVSVKVSFKNIMSVEVPEYTFLSEEQEGEIFPYGYAMTTGELDDAVVKLMGITDDLLNLAQAEKSAQLLAGEIEKCRRRVNALEHFVIPQLSETIRYIKMKLDENERGNLSRLMKVKDMMVREQFADKKQEEPM